MSALPAREHAGPVSRTIAYGVDAFIVAITCTGAAVVAAMIASVVGTWAHDLARAATSAYLLVLPAAMAVYCALFWTLAGRTPGMALLGLRVVATRDRPLFWLSALIRAVVLAYFPIGALWALVDRRHQAVHDKIARTAVVRVASPATASAAEREVSHAADSAPAGTTTSPGARQVSHAADSVSSGRSASRSPSGSVPQRRLHPRGS